MYSILSLSSRHLLHLLSLLVPTYESRHHFSLSHTLSALPNVLRFSYSLSSPLLICVFVPLPFYSPSPCTFSRRVVFLFSPSSRNFSSVSPLSLSSHLNHSPFLCIFLYPIFTLFPLLLSYLANSLNFFCVSLSSFVKSSSIYILSSFFPSTYSYLA
jgi:hypothetical protein